VAMKLYIMRHGPAEDVSSTGRDADRALTPSGRERVREVAHALVREDEAPNLIFASPLARALQTAEIVAAITKLEARGGTVETTRDIAPGGDASSFVRHLVETKQKRAMLVGHEPDLSELVHQLTNRRVEMQKAMVVGVSADSSGAGAMRIRFVLNPKALVLARE
jgi:phosphohistidine phosphatase